MRFKDKLGAIIKKFNTKIAFYMIYCETLTYLKKL